MVIIHFLRVSANDLFIFSAALTQYIYTFACNIKIINLSIILPLYLTKSHLHTTPVYEKNFLKIFSCSYFVFRFLLLLLFNDHQSDKEEEHSKNTFWSGKLLHIAEERWRHWDCKSKTIQFFFLLYRTF